MKMKSLATGTVICLSYLSAGAYASEEINCTVDFNNNSSVTFEDKDSLNQCLSKISDKTVDSATIIGSASLTGSKKRNLKLAKERATTLERVIKSKFPEANIKKISLGENSDAGRKSELIFIIRDDTDKKKITELSQTLEGLKIDIQQDKINKKNLEEQRIASINEEARQSIKKEESNAFFNENPNFRLALRAGVDTLVDYSNLSYMSGGAEFAWINRNTFIRPEVGAKFMTSISGVKIEDKEVTNVMNAYGFVGGGFGLKGFVTGARLLLGNEWINVNDKTNKTNEFAVGGEARLGYEWEKGISVFGSYALTKRIQMIGVDVGLSF